MQNRDQKIVDEQYSLSQADLVSLYARGVDVTDISYHTILRHWSIIADLLVNNSDESNDNQDSAFNIFMHHGKHIAGHTAAEWAFGLLFVVPFCIGVGIEYNRIKHLQWLNSYRNLLQHIDMAEHDSVLNRNQEEEQKAWNELMVGINDLIARNKIKFNAENANSKPKTEAKPTLVESSAKKVKSIAAIAWSALSNMALIFWLEWAVAALLTSITAASAVTGVLPILAISTVVTYAVLQLVFWAYGAYQNHKLANKLKLAGKDSKQQEHTIAEHDIAEYQHMSLEARQRMYIKREHARFKKDLLVELKKIKTQAQIDELYPRKEKPPIVEGSHFAVTGKEKNGSIRFIRNALYSATAAGISTSDTESTDQRTSIALDKHPIVTATNAKKTKRNDPDLETFLMGSKFNRGLRIVAHTINNWFSGYTLAGFILWLGGSLALGFSFWGPPLLAAIGSAVLGSMSTLVGFSIGATVGVLFSGFYVNKVKQEQAAHAKTVSDLLNEKINYKSVTDGEVSQASRLDIFNEYKTALDGLTDYVRAVQIESKKPDSKPVNNMLLNYDLSKINVFNNHYFEEQEYKASWWARTKDIIFRAYKGLNAFQTFVFIARTIFLYGTIGAAATLALGVGWLPFVIIACSLGVIGLGLRLTQIHLDESYEHRKNAAASIDVRISWMKKKIKELKGLKALAGDLHTENKPDPQPLSVIEPAVVLAPSLTVETPPHAAVNGAGATQNNTPEPTAPLSGGSTANDGDRLAYKLAAKLGTFARTPVKVIDAEVAAELVDSRCNHASAAA